MRKIILLVLVLVVAGNVVAWDTNPTYNPFEILWNAIDVLDNRTNETYMQRRINDICPSGSSIRAVNEDGTVVCETDDTGITACSTCDSTFVNAGGDTMTGDLSVGTGWTDRVQLKRAVDYPKIEFGEGYGTYMRYVFGGGGGFELNSWGGTGMWGKFLVSGTEVMRIEDDGKVGIGTSSPGYLLDVNGAANAQQLCIAGDCETSWPTTTETDPEVGTLTNNRWCTSDGSQVNCEEEAPAPAAHLHSEYLSKTGDTAIGDYNFDNGTLYVDSVNNRVGIGTDNPSAKLAVAGNAVIGSTNYNIVFATSTTYNGNLGGLTGADAKCQQRAQAVGLPGFYKAWLSDGNTNAKDRLMHSDLPYKLVDGTTIANNWADLTDGSLLASISKTEFGTSPGTWVWTSTTTDGTKAGGNYCNGWSTTDPGCIYGAYSMGQTTQTNALWTYLTAGGCYCGSSYPLYCIQQGTGNLYVQGNTGIMTTNPQYTLDVVGTGQFSDVLNTAGGLKLENSAGAPVTCDSSNKGYIYFDASLNEPCFCDGTNWKQFDAGGNC